MEERIIQQMEMCTYSDGIINREGRLRDEISEKIAKSKSTQGSENASNQKHRKAHINFCFIDYNIETEKQTNINKIRNKAFREQLDIVSVAITIQGQLSWLTHIQKEERLTKIILETR